jgi:mRNA interferase HicA
MKRRDLVRHLVSHGCSLLREGGNQSWWHNPAANRRSAVPRHGEGNERFVKKIRKDLGVATP